MLKVLVIVGPTAVGKSSLAIACAQKYHGEIISGDAIQVYKGLDIGSAKVSKAEQKMVKHHLIDIIDPKMRYSVKDFQTYARKLINEIHERHHLPIIVGGTGLYIKATIYDYQFNEESAEDDDFAALTNAEIYERIKEVDPEILEKIHVNNRKRLVRALNIINKQKMPMSHILQAQEHKPLYDAYIMGLTMPREILYERIDKRVDKMMEEGLLAEVEALLKAGAVMKNRRILLTIMTAAVWMTAALLILLLPLRRPRRIFTEERLPLPRVRRCVVLPPKLKKWAVPPWLLPAVG